MWLKLTKPNGEPLAVAADALTHISNRKHGGSSLYLDSMKSGDEVQRVLVAQESLEDIVGLMGIGT